MAVNMLRGIASQEQAPTNRSARQSRSGRGVAFATVESGSESDEPLLFPSDRNQRSGSRPGRPLRNSGGRNAQQGLGATADDAAGGDLDTRTKSAPSARRLPDLHLNTATSPAPATPQKAPPSELQMEAQKLAQVLANSPRFKPPPTENAANGLSKTSRERIRNNFLAATLPQNILTTSRKDSITIVLDRTSDSGLPRHPLPAVSARTGTFTYVPQDRVVGSSCKLIQHSLHPDQELSDDYYERAIGAIYLQIAALVETYYCAPKDLPGCYDTSSPGNNPWNCDLSDELLQHIQYIARPDPYTGGWNRLLLDRSQRQPLLIGIFAKVLETKVFNALLFGTDGYEHEMMEKMEKTLVNLDGFQRTSLRARTTRTLLDNRAITQSFDISVAKLTTQMLRLLEPLHLYVQGILNRYPHLPRPKLDDLVQDMNDVFSQAGYLSISMRTSESIFSFISARPGNYWDDKLHHSIDTIHFKESKESVMRTLADAPDHALRSDQHFCALIEISVWPAIQRHKPGNGLAGGAKRGFRVYDVCLAGTIVYWGTRDPRGKREPSLLEWRKGNDAKRLSLLPRRLPFTISGTLLVFAVSVYLLSVLSEQERIVEAFKSELATMEEWTSICTDRLVGAVDLNLTMIGDLLLRIARMMLARVR